MSVNEYAKRLEGMCKRGEILNPTSLTCVSTRGVIGRAVRASLARYEEPALAAALRGGTANVECLKANGPAALEFADAYLRHFHKTRVHAVSARGVLDVSALPVPLQMKAAELSREARACVGRFAAWLLEADRISDEFE